MEENSLHTEPEKKGQHRFSSEHQPDRQKRAAGQHKRKVQKDVLRMVMQMKFAGAADSKLKKSIALYFGIDPRRLTVELMMHMRQAEKAIQKADTYAYNSVMDRLYGKPKQNLGLGSDPDFPLQNPTPIIKVFTSGPPLAGNEDEVDETRE